MLKKILIVAIVLVLALAQGYFIHAAQHGAIEAFTGAWSSFNVTQSNYSQFVFRTIKWWWALPAICLLLVGFATWRPTVSRVILTLSFSLIGTIALYWSAYAPSLFIQL